MLSNVLHITEELKRPRYVDNVYAAIESKCLLFWSHPFVSEARKLGERDIPAVCDVPSSWTDISGRFSYRRFVARRDLQDPRWDLGEADKFEEDVSLKDVSKFSYATYLFLRKLDYFLKSNSDTSWHFVIENYVIDDGNGGHAPEITGETCRLSVLFRIEYYGSTFHSDSVRQLQRRVVTKKDKVIWENITLNSSGTVSSSDAYFE